MLRTAGSAAGCVMRTSIRPSGLETDLKTSDGDLAFLESELRMTGADEFVESGRIAFGEDSGHALLFSTAGLGHIIAGPADGIMTGTASWIIEGGEGQFRAARGLINSTFTIDDAGQRCDFQCGLIFLPDSQPVDEAPQILDAARDSAL